ncbi:hypothetical protein [Tsuneonella amylolytica]|uniref:hypothetical protein n=1 Tax=Tsuneonella amylolytica TaxID=2338327 RepID=UPI000EAA31E3|nr:hypothetical protein [Tsuneonella amylolytica]
MIRSTSMLALVLALAGCNSEDAPEPARPRDPQVAQALNDPLMTDPDLSARNEGGAALTVDSDFSLPVIPATPEEIARAKVEAQTILGGSTMLVVPSAPVATTDPLPADADAPSRLAVLVGNTGACRSTLAKSAIWAARMPAAMPIYPRGHTVDAAGSDDAACRVRTAAFTTPVPRADVMAFYLARTQAIGGKGSPLMRAGEDWRLRGAAGALAYDVFARPQGDHTLVRLTVAER